MRLESPVTRFLTQLRADGRSPHTIRQYARHLRLFGEWWGGTCGAGEADEIAHIDHEALASFLASDAALLRPDGKGKKAASMNALRTSVRCFFDYLQRSGQLASNPARVVRMARVPEAIPKPLKPTEVTRLTEVLASAEGTAAARDRSLFGFLLATGARLGSALALDVADVDLDAQEAHLGELKGGGSLTVYLPGDAVGQLESAIDGRRAGPVFCAQGGGRLSARHVQRRFEHWLEAAGIPPRYSPHSLRHTFASRLYERTGDILVVKEALGHKSISSTMVYARATQDRVRAAVAG